MNERELQKEQCEREVLECFLQFTQRTQWAVEKRIRPDYIIVSPEEEKIGVEITRLTTEDAQVTFTIADENRGPRDDPDCVKERAILRHGRKAKRCGYTKAGNSLLVTAPVANLRKEREDFAKAIERKYQKYETQMENYDKFVILCDARMGIEITKGSEVDAVINHLDRKKFSKHFQVAILYCESNRERRYKQIDL